MKLFPSSGPLEFEAINIFGPLMQTKLRNRFIVVKTSRFSKLTRAITVATITAPNVATAVLETLVIPHRAPEIIFTENGKQFASKFIAALCAFRGRNLATTI